MGARFVVTGRGEDAIQGEMEGSEAGGVYGAITLARETDED